LHVRLSDGRRVGCLEVGSTDGFPIFHFHGNGSSRLEVMMLTDLAIAAGVRLIGLDRPGIGDSDPAPGRTLIDWPHDVAQVADRLQIGRFAVEGVSAGGAYALACAHRITDRLTGCGLISSICPPELVRRAAPGWVRVGWWLAEHHPDLVHAWMRALLPDSPLDEASAERRLLRITSWLARPDRAVLSRPAIRQALVRSMTESRRQGAAANRLEVLALLRSWNLRIEQIALREIFLWHGEQDRLTPVGPARLLADTLPHCTATFYAGEGHFSTLANHAQDVFAVLRRPVT
jgi:pimeloyl-ACP methyl ester carboxylesterase